MIYRTGQHYDSEQPSANGIGGTSNRLIVSWGQVEPRQPGTWGSTCSGDVVGTHCYDWDIFDTAYERMRDAGQTPVLTVMGAPGWARDPNAPDPSTCPYRNDRGGPDCVYPPDAAFDDQWKAFVRQAALRFPDILAVEVWNEPNFDHFWYPDPDPVRYATLLRKACVGVNEAYTT